MAEKILLGIDEAGRGPVIGSMVVCGVVLKEKDIINLEKIGVKDSKLLSPESRQRLAKLIKNIALDWKIVKIPPRRIDRYGITYPHLKSIAELIDKFSPDIAIIDSPTNSPSSCVRKIRSLAKNLKVKIKVEIAADKKYPVVSAASILAKVERDREIENLSLAWGEIGSGYPSDKKTVDFLKKCLKEKKSLPDIVRKRWKTVKRASLLLKKENESG